VTQVVLPAAVLVRRRDGVAVIGRAWRCFAGGGGARRVARLLDLPMGTVRGWLRRLRAHAGIMFGTQGNHHERLSRALASAVSAANEAGWQAEGDIWQFVSYRSEGQLLCNTSWP
jgi:hypothetical protein